MATRRVVRRARVERRALRRVVVASLRRARRRVVRRAVVAALLRLRAIRYHPPGNEY